VRQPCFRMDITPVGNGPRSHACMDICDCREGFYGMPSLQMSLQHLSKLPKNFVKFLLQSGK